MNLDLSVIMTVEEFLGNEEFEATITKKNKVSVFILPKGRIYNIPAYQREIRWEPKNIIALFEDLKDDVKFLGNILISKKDEGEYDIIDGQQRFTALLLLIKALTEKGKIKTLKLVNFNNKSLTSFDEMLDNGFDEEKLKAKANYNQIIEDDVLDQREVLKALWDAVNDGIAKKISLKECNTLFKHLLRSNVNVIMSEETGGIYSDSVCLDYYIDINDKAVKLDSIDIMKAQLFKKDFETMTSRWEAVQKSLKAMRMNGANYSYNDFYFHFFACTINPYYDYSLKTLNRSLKVLSEVTVRGAKIEAGSHIIDAAMDPNISETSLNLIEKCANFFASVMKARGEYPAMFEDFFKEKPGTEMAKIIFHITTVLLKMENDVPKILLMKYYLDVILPGDKARYNTIFDIYTSSILFNLVKAKKSSGKFVSLVMQKKWTVELGAYALDKYKNDLQRVNYTQKVKENGKVTETSGQYIPKHIFAIRQFLDAPTGAQSVRCLNKHFLCNYLDESEMTAEHFFVNQSYKFVFRYGEDGKSKGTVTCPKKLKKWISCPFNYLYIKKLDNASFGDATVMEKIEYLNRKDKSVFANKLVYAYFLEIKKIFDDGSFPDLTSVKNKREAERMVRNYYNDVFPEKIKEYVNKIPSIRLNYDKSNISSPWSIVE